MNNSLDTSNNSNNNFMGNLNTTSDNNNQVNSIDVNNNIINSEPKKKNKKLKIILISIIVILLMVVGGLIAYKEIVLFNKESVIKTSIASIFDALEKNYDTYNNKILPFDANEESIGIDGTFKASSNNKTDDVDLTKLSNYNIKYNGVLDLKNNKMSGSMSLNKDNNTLLSGNMYINGKYGLVESSQLSYYAYSFNIQKEIKEINLNNKDNSSNIKNLISRTKSIILSKINDNDIIRDNVDDTINGNKANYTRFTYKVDINNLVNEVLKQYIQDTSITNIISEVTSTDSQTIKKFIQRIIDSNNNKNIMCYEIYVDSLIGTFKQAKIYSEEHPNNYLKVYEVGDGYAYETINDDFKTNGFFKDNKISFETDNNKIEIEKINSEETKISYKYNKENVYLVLDINLFSQIENDKQDLNVVVNLNYGDNSQNENYNLKLENELTIKKNASVKPIAAFITKDINTIDVNEEGDIKSKYESIMSEIINDIYPGYSKNINNYNKNIYYNINSV